MENLNLNGFDDDSTNDYNIMKLLSQDARLVSYSEKFDK